MIPAYLTLDEVVARYRGQLSAGTLRNWRSMRIGPSFIKIGKAVLYPVQELDQWDRSNPRPVPKADPSSDGRSVAVIGADRAYELVGPPAEGLIPTNGNSDFVIDRDSKSLIGVELDHV